MGKKFSAIFTALFFCACLIPSLGMLASPQQQGAANEVLSPKPVLQYPDGSWNIEYLSDAADYFSDHFAFRQELITLDSALKAGIFHTSSQDQVALGKDGWLFYKETLDDYSGADCLTQRQAFSIGRSFALAQSYVESQGGEFLFTIAPNKVSLYPQYMEDTLEPGQVTAASQVQDALASQGVAYSNLFEAFGEQDEILYHKWDSHWTYRGAALAHDVLLKDLGLTGDMFERSGSYQPTHSGDLYEMLYPASSLLDDQWHFQTQPQFQYDSPIRDVDDMRIQTSSQGTYGNLLMFRDSFGNTLHSLLAEDFSHALFTRAQPYDLRLMDQIQADYVLVEIVERNLPLLSQIPFIHPAAQVTFHESVEQTDLSVTAQTEVSPSTPEYVTLTGWIPPCDVDSPIYLKVDQIVYEASPVGPESVSSEYFPFTAYLPADTDTTSIQVIYKKDGRWYSGTLDL